MGRQVQEKKSSFPRSLFLLLVHFFDVDLSCFWNEFFDFHGCISQSSVLYVFVPNSLSRCCYKCWPWHFSYCCFCSGHSFRAICGLSFSTFSALARLVYFVLTKIPNILINALIKLPLRSSSSSICLKSSGIWLQKSFILSVILPSVESVPSYFFIQLQIFQVYLQFLVTFLFLPCLSRTFLLV